MCVCVCVREAAKAVEAHQAGPPMKTLQAFHVEEKLGIADKYSFPYKYSFAFEAFVVVV